MTSPRRSAPRAAEAAPKAPRRSVPPIDPSRFAPSEDRPVRAKARHLAAQTQVDPHRHAWGQLAFSVTGAVRVTAGAGTYIVPPSRAVWIPPGIEHVVHVVEDAEIRTVYVHQDAQQLGPWPAHADEAAEWRECRVVEVSNLLRELVAQLAAAHPDDGSARAHHLGALVLDELRRAARVPLGVDLPQDKRLRALCEAVLADPTRWSTLEDCARGVGASPRTVARLFRSELGTTFLQWRQQVLIAKAVAMNARKVPLGVIAAELGYASPSAFTAMVRRSLGAPPSRFFS